MSVVHSNGSNVRTVISMNTYTFCWTVENFSKLPWQTGVVSPTFHPQPNHAFHERIYFYKSSGSDIEIKHFASIMNRAGQIFSENVIKHNYGSQSSDSSCTIMTTNMNEITKEVKKYLQDDVLILKCVLEFGTIQTESDQYKFRPKPVSALDDLSALSKDLQSMFDASVYADINLKVGDSTVRVHKSVMCARSSVFARMFETPMGESEKSVISITDLDISVLKDLVAYLYTGMLTKDDFESVYALYYAADKYDVSSLQKTCVDVLLSRLEVENACRALSLADRHSDVEFKESVMEFIKFYLKDVLETDGWDELVENATSLAAEVMSLRTKKDKNNKGKTDTA